MLLTAGIKQNMLGAQSLTFLYPTKIKNIQKNSLTNANNLLNYLRKITLE